MDALMMESGYEGILFGVGVMGVGLVIVACLL